MDISTYSSLPSYDKLVGAVEAYLNRTDSNTKKMIPFFINAAEKVILRTMRMPSMEKMVGFTIDEVGIGDEGWVPVPSDYLEMKHVWVEGQALQRITFDQILQKHELYSGNDCVRGSWAINANRMYIRDVPRDSMIYLTYYADIPEISSETQNNVLLDLLPDAFLFMATAEGFRYLMEEQKADYWEGQGYSRMSAVQQQVDNAEFSGSTTVVSSTPLTPFI